MTHKQARILLCALVILLIVEGLLRKRMPDNLADLALFLKDLLVLPLIPYVLRNRSGGVVGRVFSAYLVTLALFLPLAAYTATRDPILAVFGLKQYVLYPWVAFAWARAFITPDAEAWKTPYWILGFSLFITFPVALLQINLPSSHWLNLGVGGGDLSGFAAGGVQRVSSTFSFIAQYNYYLLFLPASLAICHFLRKEGPVRTIAFSLLVITAGYIVSVFITGSRTSVIGSLTVLILALFLFLQKARSSLFPKVLGLAVALYVGFNLTAFLFPNAFIAYRERTRGMDNKTHTEEVFQRMVDSYTLWWERIFPRAGFFGFGLGTMSNGVQAFSSYASHIRATQGWGETDMANTMMEGGLYLVLVWKGFRLYIVFCCWQVFRKIKSTLFVLPGAFFLSHVIIEGVNGALGIQPPAAIWFWSSVGSLLLLHGLELQRTRRRKAAREAAASAKFQAS